MPTRQHCLVHDCWADEGTHEPPECDTIGLSVDAEGNHTPGA